jgi:hypothetical protein
MSAVPGPYIPSDYSPSDAGAEVLPHAGRAVGRARLHDRMVRAMGTVPFQGRRGTLELIHLCHDAEGPEGRRLAWARLRHAAVMNAVRHAAPLPFGALATVQYEVLATRHRHGLLILWAGCAAVLTVISAAVAYTQGSIHLHLARGLLARPDHDVRGGSPRTAARARPERRRVYRRDRVVTTALVVLALVTVGPGAGLALADAADGPSDPVLHVVDGWLG